jgi:type IV secretory pathway VirB3-like protein
MSSKIKKDSSSPSISENFSMGFYFGDKLAEFIDTKLKWTPLKTAGVALIQVWLLDILVASFSDRIRPKTGFRALTEDYFWWVAVITVVPLAWGYYIWLCTSPSKVIKKLENSGTVELLPTSLQEISKILQSRTLTRFAGILGISVGIFWFFQGIISPPLWFNSNPFYLALHILVWAFTYFAALSAILRLIMNARVFNRVLKNVVLHPLHPDKSGGLLPLGQYALTTTYPIALMGTIAMFAEYWVYTRNEFSTAYMVHGMVLLYFVLAPLVFVAPLWAAHDSMLRAKEDMMIQISRQFNKDFSLAYKELSSNAKALKDNIDKIEQLKKLYEVASTFPVWPFDMATIQRFLVTMTSPLSGLIIPLIVDYLKKLLF